MYIARILYPVEVLGPGKRIGIWLCGCSHHCKGCSNPELWNFDDRYIITIYNALKLIRGISNNNQVDGFTITGGEPFLQADDLYLLISELRNISDDILVYSGYTFDELSDMQNTAVNNILSSITVLVDGKYIESRNNNCVLRGSDNQNIHFLSSKYQEKYTEYLLQPNRIQNFTIGNSIVSVGIHKAGFNK